MTDLNYKGKTLVKREVKSGGKNSSNVDGFYADGEGAEYFIKKPLDRVEFFCELFAGLLLKQFHAQGILTDSQIRLLVCADVIEINEGEYALIQSKESFEELYKVINTGTSDNSDRSPSYENTLGVCNYADYLSSANRTGLSRLLFYSLLFGDHSVHSGNVFERLNDTLTAKEFGRIDWGASFRYYAHKDNGILEPAEYTGFGFYKKHTKNYIAFYKAIPDLFPSIGRRATEFSHLLGLSASPLNDIIASALDQIPTDLFSPEDKQGIADYLCIPGANQAFGQEDDCNLAFAQSLSLFMKERVLTMQHWSNHPEHPLFQFISKKSHNLIQSLMSTRDAISRFIAITWDSDEDFNKVQCVLKSNKTFIKGLQDKKSSFLKELCQLLDSDRNPVSISQDIDDLILELTISDNFTSVSEMQQYNAKITTFIAKYQGIIYEQLGKLETLTSEQTDAYILAYASASCDKPSIAEFKQLLSTKGDPDCNRLKCFNVVFEKALLQDNEAWSLIEEDTICRLIADSSCPELTDGLALKLQKIMHFKQQQLLSHKSKKYIKSINSFHHEAIKICLSEQSSDEQKKALSKAAHTHFNHRHLATRLLADALLLVSSLFFGLSLLIRYAYKAPNTPMLFSSQQTAREQAVDSMLIPSLEN